MYSIIDLLFAVLTNAYHLLPTKKGTIPQVSDKHSRDNIL